MQLNINKMKVSYVCLFSLLLIAGFTQVKSEDDFQTLFIENVLQQVKQDSLQLTNRYTTNLFKYFIQHAGQSISNHLTDILTGYRHQVIEEANDELKMLTKKPGLCSLHKSKKIKALRNDLLRNSSCLDLGQSWSNVTSLLNETIRTSIVLVYDVGNFTTNLANCTVGDGKVQCLLDALQALENDIKDIIPKLGDSISRVLSLVLDIIKSILECFNTQQSLQTKLEHYIKVKCRDHEWHMLT